MVSPPHEAMYRIFQRDPGLFSRIPRFLGVDLPRPVGATTLPTDLGETGLVLHRVDALLRFNTAESGAYLLAVDIQDERNSERPASWAYCTAYLWKRYRLPTTLLVVCQDHATAEWAQRAVSSGPSQLPTLTLRPMVAGPHNMPVITDPDEARADLVLAGLAAVTHAAAPAVNPILKALSTALRDVPADIADPIVEFTARGLRRHPAKHLWRSLVAVDLTPAGPRLLENMREEVRAESERQCAAEDVLTVLAERGLDVSDQAGDRINGCDAPHTLSHWLRRAVTAPTTEAIFDADE